MDKYRGLTRDKKSVKGQRIEIKDKVRLDPTQFQHSFIIERHFIIPQTDDINFQGDGGFSDVTMYEIIPETLGKFVGITDINGDEIYDNNLVEFDLLLDNKKSISLKGNFYFNDEELRYEIDILQNAKAIDNGYFVLWYDWMKMKNFKIIGDCYDD